MALIIEYMIIFPLLIWKEFSLAHCVNAAHDGPCITWRKAIKWRVTNASFAWHAFPIGGSTETSFTCHTVTLGALVRSIAIAGCAPFHTFETCAGGCYAIATRTLHKKKVSKPLSKVCALFINELKTLNKTSMHILGSFCLRNRMSLS